MRNKLLPLGITIGDPGGIGPELSIKSLWKLHREGRINIPIRLFGSVKQLRYIAEKLQLPPVDEIPKVELADPMPELGPFPLGQFSTEGARAQVLYLQAAFSALKKGELGAITTGPINKLALQNSSLPYRGHTDWLEDLFQTEVAMVLSTPELSVVPITAHIPLRQVPDSISTEKITKKTLLAAQTIKELYSLNDIAIAICGLNPHAGEGGLLGDEDRKIIAPAVNFLKNKGLRIDGPLPADSLFAEKIRKKYQLIIGMYHDQVLTPIKTLFFNRIINITAGLPALRTSPDHGVAYSLAGNGKAEPSSFFRAISTALNYLMAKNYSNGTKKKNVTFPNKTSL